MRGFLLGLVLGLLAIPVAVWGWLTFGHPPVAVADAPMPFEKQIVRVPLQARIQQEMPKQIPMAASPVNLLLGAEVYRTRCAACHGLYGRPSEIGPHMFPHAPQLWAPHGRGVVGVSDDPVGHTFWLVQNGVRLSGMPAFNKTLSDAQMWQVSLLLASAAKPLPADVLGLMQQPLAPDPAAAMAAPAMPAAGPTNIPVEPLPQQ